MNTKGLQSFHNVKMSILLSIMMIALFSCTNQANTAPTPALPPTQTHMPACTNNVCVKDVYLQIVNDENLLIQFDLVDQNFEVNFGENLEFQSKITFALYLLEENGEDTYLAGMNPGLDLFECYMGNDIPWSNGNLASACGLTIPLNLLQVRPEYGDPIRLEIIDPAFEATAIWLDN